MSPVINGGGDDGGGGGGGSGSGVGAPNAVLGIVTVCAAGSPTESSRAPQLGAGGAGVLVEESR